MAMPQSVATDLVLYAGCMPAAPFRDYVAAAAEAGFDAITMWPLIYRRAQSREGLTPATMRMIVDDAGLRITDLDPVGDWLPAPPGDEAPPMFRSVWRRHQFLECATALGIGHLTAVQLTPDPVRHEVAVEGFATLCDDAAEHGLHVQLEFMPFSGLSDLPSALRVLLDADRPNSGLLLDVCHFVRSGGTPAQLAVLPPALVRSVQLGDGASAAPPDLRDEAMYHRQLPGDGEFGVTAVLADLAARGVRCAVGPEVYRRGFSERAPTLVAADLMDSTRRVLA